MWPTVPLGDLVEITIGRTPPRDDDHYWTTELERPFCSIADIHPDGVFVDPVREGVTAAAEKNGKAKRVPAGSLLMSFKLSIGRTAIAARDVFPNEAIAWLQPRADVGVELNFLRLYLPIHDYAASVGVAVKGQTLNQKTLKALEIPLPPVAIQRRIVRLVTAVEEARDAADALVTQGELVRRARLLAAFDPDRAEAAGWRRARIADVAEVTGGKAFPKKHQGRAAGAFPYFRVSDLNLSGNEREMTVCANWITEGERDQLGVTIRPVGTVIFPIIGAALKTEKRRILSVPGAFDQNLIGLVPSKAVVPEFLLALMEVVELSRFGREGPVPLLNQQIVGNLPIWLPESNEEQQQIAERNEAAAAETMAAAELIASLVGLKDALLHELVLGDRVIPEAFDDLPDPGSEEASEVLIGA